MLPSQHEAMLDLETEGLAHRVECYKKMEPENDEMCLKTDE